MQLSINARARELPYTFIFSLARRGVSCGGAPRSAPEILNRLNEVSMARSDIADVYNLPISDEEERGMIVAGNILGG